MRKLKSRIHNIESRALGIWAAAEATVEINGDLREFIILEEEVGDLFGDDGYSAEVVRNSVLKIFLKQNKDGDIKDLLGFIMENLDTAFNSSEVERWIICEDCKKTKNIGLHRASRLFDIEDKREKCFPGSVH